MQVRDLLPPVRAGGRPTRFWQLIVAPSDRREEDRAKPKPRKAQTYDDGIPLDFPAWLGPALSLVSAGRQPTDPLFDLHWGDVPEAVAQDAGGPRPPGQHHALPAAARRGVVGHSWRGEKRAHNDGRRTLAQCEFPGALCETGNDPKAVDGHASRQARLLPVALGELGAAGDGKGLVGPSMPSFEKFVSQLKMKEKPAGGLLIREETGSLDFCAGPPLPPQGCPGSCQSERKDKCFFVSCRGMRATELHGFVQRERLLRGATRRQRKKFVEECAGTCRIARAVSARGLLSESCGILRDSVEDILTPPHCNLVYTRACRGMLGGVRLGLTCACWSRARRGTCKGGFPAPLSSDSCVLGLPGLTPSNQGRVELGNVFADCACLLIRLSIHFQCCLVVENPRSSMLWLHPKIAALSKYARRDMIFSHCGYGAPLRKDTRLLAFNIVLTALDGRCCPRVVNGARVCSSTGVPHVQLCGASSLGWKTSIASAYPWKFCRAFAQQYELQCFSP